MFAVGSFRIALALSRVQRVIHAVAVTPLPGAPAAVRGLIDVGGEIRPVFDLKRRFALPERDIDLKDCLILASCSRPVALLVDSIAGVERSIPMSLESLQCAPEQLSGVARLDEGLVLIQDLDRFLMADEAVALDGALAAWDGHGR